VDYACLASDTFVLKSGAQSPAEHYGNYHRRSYCSSWLQCRVMLQLPNRERHYIHGLPEKEETTVSFSPSSRPFTGRPLQCVATSKHSTFFMQAKCVQAAPLLCHYYQPLFLPSPCFQPWPASLKTKIATFGLSLLFPWNYESFKGMEPSDGFS
jgi:hypothetical protein